MSAAVLEAKSVRDSVSEAEWALRVDLAAAYRLVAHFGWDDLIFTHLSARVDGPEHHFLINPYNLMFDEITASSLVKIDVDGNQITKTPYPTNAAGFVIHSAIHMAREDAQAVLHLHTPHGQAVSAMKEGLLPLTQTAMIVAHDLAYHDYEGVATNLSERETLARDLGRKNAMLLRNHGTLTVGESMAAAFTRMYFLERACEAQVHMLSAGLDHLQAPAEEMPGRVEEQTPSEGVNKISQMLIWPALLRKLDRIDASFRD